MSYTIRKLLEHGADIHAKDIFGKTPLHYASKERDYISIKYLMRNNANANVVDKFNLTPLEYCIKGSYSPVSIIYYLILRKILYL
ncbi:SWPV1-299 [Shearwaterpox virus]|uniref:SWPV1-299 n=1 Tax=Shearwaterpox virus TaxID=1974596 RepID=A0A1V0S8A9_CNPV|nr:SWPV1-299 [Shearwaterpox virus]